MITVIDYGMGNLGSLVNMFKYLGVQATIASDPEDIKLAKKILLPGVGAFDSAMLQINKTKKLRSVLEAKALVEKVPMLGVCLGMQLLTRGSEEGKMSGLGFIPADTCRIPPKDGLKVPHMGWNLAKPTKVPSALLNDVDHDARYYFVHSYAVHVDETVNSIMKTEHSVLFDSGICCKNIYGVQFHPEKSHKFGMKILRNFARL